jgi:hypothetical protein
MVKSVDADDLESATPMGTNETTIRCATARDALARRDATSRRCILCVPVD